MQIRKKFFSFLQNLFQMLSEFLLAQFRSNIWDMLWVGQYPFAAVLFFTLVVYRFINLHYTYGYDFSRYSFFTATCLEFQECCSSLG